MFGYKIIRQEKFEAMQDLIATLEAFVFVAETDGSKSRAVQYAREELSKYKEIE